MKVKTNFLEKAEDEVLGLGNGLLVGTIIPADMLTGFNHQGGLPSTVEFRKRGEHVRIPLMKQLSRNEDEADDYGETLSHRPEPRGIRPDEIVTDGVQELAPHLLTPLSERFT